MVPAPTHEQSSTVHNDSTQDPYDAKVGGFSAPEDEYRRPFTNEQLLRLGSSRGGTEAHMAESRVVIRKSSQVILIPK